MPVIQTTGAGTATWVSAADMMSLMALILGMFGELTFPHPQSLAAISYGDVFR